MDETGQTTTVAKQQPPPDTIRHEDEAALGWFFGKGRVAFEKSTCGFMLDRLALEAHTSRECMHCLGTGVMPTDMDVPVYTEDVHGKQVTWGAGNWCPKCKGTGSTPVRRRASKEELTVKITAEDKTGGGYVPDDKALTTYAVVSRRIGLLNPELAEALAAYYGDAGARWGATKRGRLFALYVLTRCGQKLLRSCQADSNPDDSDLELPAHEQIGVQADLEDVQPKGNRRALLVGAAEQAMELYRKAAQAWNEARPGQ